MGEVPGSGCLLVGDKGKLFSPDDYGARFFVKLKDEKELMDGQKHEAVKAIPQTIPRNAFKGDADYRHHLEWIAGVQRRADSVLELRHRRVSDRDHPARLRGLAHGQETGVGRPEHARHQRPGVRSVRDP